LRSGERHNDAEAQMRAMAMPMTDREIDEVATLYARKAAPAGVQGH
jgi:cytochrome c553